MVQLSIFQKDTGETEIVNSAPNAANSSDWWPYKTWIGCEECLLSRRSTGPLFTWFETAWHSSEICLSPSSRSDCVISSIPVFPLKLFYCRYIWKTGYIHNARELCRNYYSRSCDHREKFTAKGQFDGAPWRDRIHEMVL